METQDRARKITWLIMFVTSLLFYFIVEWIGMVYLYVSSYVCVCMYLLKSDVLIILCSCILFNISYTNCIGKMLCDKRSCTTRESVSGVFITYSIIYIYIYIYIYQFTHMCIHTYTHTHTHSNLLSEICYFISACIVVSAFGKWWGALVF